MISILGSSGRITDMRKVIDQMKADSCQCKDTVFATAINTYAQAGLLDEAITLFRNLPKFNCVNWTESFNTLLGILINESKLETAHRLFLEHSYGWEVKSRTRSLTLLIKALCQSGRSDLAVHVFLEFNSQCCYPGKETYRILMRGLCDDGRLDDATHLLYSMFWRISQKGSGEDVVIYRTLLHAFVERGHIEEAVELLGKILRKGLKAPKRCLKQLDLSSFHNCDDKGAKYLIDDALIKGGISSSDSYNVMAVDLYSEGNIGTANRVIQEMHYRGFRPTLLIYEAKIAALCRHGTVDEAIEVIEKEMVNDNCLPTIKLFNTVMKGLCDEGRSVMAIGYLKKIFRQVGCVPDKDTYSILVDGLCAEAKYIEAGQILEEMLKNSYSPGENTYNSLIQGLCSMGRPFEAIMWLEEMVSQAKMPNVSVWKSLVASVCAEKFSTTTVSAVLEPISKTIN
ncbi:pentatricopeptide repeat-containing protein At1g05600 isoform X2 [Daucus carota subsp. sativus]|nr:PREDICTED: pentatricopeptide repeat-containing protein At1g05600 isoform X2 [Daucus carota subsp. sativus]